MGLAIDRGTTLGAWLDQMNLEKARPAESPLAPPAGEPEPFIHEPPAPDPSGRQEASAEPAAEPLLTLAEDNPTPAGFQQGASEAIEDLRQEVSRVHDDLAARHLETRDVLAAAFGRLVRRIELLEASRQDARTSEPPAAQADREMAARVETLEGLVSALIARVESLEHGGALDQGIFEPIASPH